MTHFERGLYADPDADHDARWWDLVERFQLVRRPDDRHAPDWAATIHLASAPVYYHNYQLGEMVASQLTATLGGLVGNERADGRARSPLVRPGRNPAVGSPHRTGHGQSVAARRVRSRFHELRLEHDVRHAVRPHRRRDVVRQELRSQS